MTNLTWGMGAAQHRMNNGLRYRDAGDPRQVQYTPSWLVEAARSILGGIDLDPCTTEDNPVRAKIYFTPERSGLTHEWWNCKTAFVNPPYGKAREPWVERCIDGARRNMKIILLMPSATDTRCFQKAAEMATEVLFLRG